MTERSNEVTFKGKPLTLLGSTPGIGEEAPDATLLANDLSEAAISDSLGKVCILSVVPSLDTPVCDAQTRRFNTEAGSFGDDVVILTISMDLPFAQARWCGSAGIEAVRTLSDHREAAFGAAYGVLVEELRFLARAVFVLDREGIIRHVEIVDEMTRPPDYDAALAVMRQLL